MAAYLRRHPCTCGEADPTVLEFDHLGDKICGVAYAIRHFAIMRLLEEMLKCVVRCVNCHRRRTAEVNGGFKWFLNRSRTAESPFALPSAD